MDNEQFRKSTEKNCLFSKARFSVIIIPSNDSKYYAGMVELVDSEDLGSFAERRAGSSPVTRTKRLSYLAGALCARNSAYRSFSMTISSTSCSRHFIFSSNAEIRASRIGFLNTHILCSSVNCASSLFAELRLFSMYLITSASSVSSWIRWEGQ